MSLVGAIALYFVVWWITLFAVLPFGTRPRDALPEEGGWRGTPEAPHLLRKVAVNSVLAALVWLLIWYALRENWLGLQSAS